MLSKSQAKYIQTLHHKKFRDQELAFIAEGEKVVMELLSSSFTCTLVVALNEWWQLNEGLVRKRYSGPIAEALPHELEKISALATPNQVLAVFDIPKAKEPLVSSGWTLVLDAIRDPGNMGTIIRIADWYGIPTLICSEDCADIYNPKVVQSTMGSLPRVQVWCTDLPMWLTKQTSRKYAAVLEGKPIQQLHGVAPGILVIGNESHGIREEVLAACNEKITIPRLGKAESLNAAVATGIILSHL